MRHTTRLILLAIASALLPLALALSVSIWQTARERREHQAARLAEELRVAESLLRARASEVERLAAAVASLIETFNFIEITAAPAALLLSTSEQAVAALQSTAEANRTSFYAYLARLLEGNDIDFLIITDDSGRAVFRSQRPTAIGDRLLPHPLLRRALDGSPARGLVLEARSALEREGVAERALVRKLTEEGDLEKSGLCIEAAAPIFSNRRVIGAVLAGDLLNNDFALVDRAKQALYSDRLAMAGLGIFIAGTAVATNLPEPGGGRALGAQLPASLAGEVLDQGKRVSGIFPFLTASYAIASQPLFDSDRRIVGALAVASAQPESGILAALQSFLPALGAALAGLAVALYLAVRLGRPVSRLAQTAENVSLGQLDTSDLAAQARGDRDLEQMAEALERLRLSIKLAAKRLA